VISGPIKRSDIAKKLKLGHKKRYKIPNLRKIAKKLQFWLFLEIKKQPPWILNCIFN